MSVRASFSVLILALCVCTCTSSDVDRDGNGGTFTMLEETANGTLTATDTPATLPTGISGTTDPWTITLSANMSVTIAMCRVNSNITPHFEIVHGGHIITPTGLATSTPDGEVIYFTAPDDTVDTEYVIYASDAMMPVIATDDGKNRDYALTVTSMAVTCPTISN